MDGLAIVGPGITRHEIQHGRFPAYRFTVDGLPETGAYLSLHQLPHNNRTWIIAKVYVASSFRRQGYASRLLQYICEMADGNGWELRLSVKPQADRPMNLHQLCTFYRKFGFAGVFGMIRVRQVHSYFSPGSDESVANGCTCSPQANHYGRGVYRTHNEVGYNLAEDCPLHGEYKKTSDRSVAQSEEGVGG